jgi:hypothetical protein
MFMAPMSIDRNIEIEMDWLNPNSSCSRAVSGCAFTRDRFETALNSKELEYFPTADLCPRLKML